jgi:predicted DNA binding protein
MFGLKRFKIKLTYNEYVRPWLEILFMDIDHIVVQQQFTTSIKDFILLCEIRWKKREDTPHEKLMELKRRIPAIDDITELRTDGKSTLCFIIGAHDPIYIDLFSKLTKEYLTFIEYPLAAREDFGILTLVGTPKDTKRLISAMQDFGSDIEIIAVTNYFSRDRGILAVLTQKQQEVLKHAYDNGFFDHPRRISARELSKKAGIAHTTYLTHIRKSQNRILTALFGRT